MNNFLIIENDNKFENIWVSKLHQYVGIYHIDMHLQQFGDFFPQTN